MSKVKVIEVEALKLDPDATYLIVFNSELFSMEQMQAMDMKLRDQGVSFVGTMARDPERALKVFQIPKDQQ